MRHPTKFEQQERNQEKQWNNQKEKEKKMVK